MLKTLAVLAGAGAAVVVLLVLAVTFLGTSTTGSASGPTLPPSLTLDPAHGPGGLPAGLYAQPTGGPLVIDNASAGQVIEASWPLRLKALADGDRALLTKTETGAQLRSDLYTCGCDPPPGTAFDSWSASAVGQTHYPASFLGQVTLSLAGKRTVELMVFTRASADAPWKLQEMTGFVPRGTGDALLSSPSNDDSLTQHLIDMPFTPTDPTQLESAVNAYWTSWATTGSEDPGSVIGGPAAREVGQGMVDDQHAAQAAGATLTIEAHDASPSPPALFPTDQPDGSGLLCGGTTLVSTYTPATPGGTVNQAGGTAAALPPQVPPGRYSRIVLQTYFSWCTQLTAYHLVNTFLGFTGVHVVAAEHHI